MLTADRSRLQNFKCFWVALADNPVVIATGWVAENP
jgi:hypothetical protein